MQLRVADLLRSNQQLDVTRGWSPHRTWLRTGAMRDAEGDLLTSRFGMHRRIVGAEPKKVPLVAVRPLRSQISDARKLVANSVA